MRVKCGLALLVIIAILLANFAVAQSSDNAVKAADVAFAQATKERGLDGWMSFFADDAYVGTKPSVQGKENLRKFYQGLFARRDLRFEWAPEQAEVFESGIMGYTSGRYTMSFTNYQGTTITQRGSYITVWQKQPDATWKVLADFGSQDKPASTAPHAQAPAGNQESSKPESAKPEEP